MITALLLMAMWGSLVPRDRIVMAHTMTAALACPDDKIPVWYLSDEHVEGVCIEIPECEDVTPSRICTIKPTKALPYVSPHVWATPPEQPIVIIPGCETCATTQEKK